MNVTHSQLKFHNIHKMGKFQNHCGTYSAKELIQAMTLFPTGLNRLPCCSRAPI